MIVLTSNSVTVHHTMKDKELVADKGHNQQEWQYIVFL